MTEDLIRAAVEDAPKNKATAYDSVNPKQIAMLDSVGIKALAIIWECIEDTESLAGHGGNHGTAHAQKRWK